MEDPAPSAEQPAAHTVADARATGAAKLVLQSQKLQRLPSGIRQLALTELDLTDNPLQHLECSQLPPGLTALRVGGCGLAGALPAGLTRMPQLQQLVAGANRITSIDAAFSCPRLVYASLAYNAVRGIEAAAEDLNSSCLMMLDLAHNNCCDLAALLRALARLPKLQALTLVGNPVCLLPGYKQRVLQALPRLVYLDSKRVDGVASKPSAEQAGGAGADSQPGGAPQGEARLLRLHISGLALEPDDIWQRIHATTASASADTDASSRGSSPASPPAAAAAAAAEAPQAVRGAAPPSRPASGKPRADPSPHQQQQPSAGPAAGGACVEQPVAPLRPVVYHVELLDAEGTGYCSLPLVVQPPEVVPAAAASTGRRPGSSESRRVSISAVKPAQAAGRAGSPPAKPGPAAARARRASQAAAEAAAAAAADAQLGPGGMRVTLGLPADVAGRDWLRGGCTLRLVRTHEQPLPAAQQPGLQAALAAAAEAAAAAATAAAGAKPGTKAAAAPPSPRLPPIDWCYVAVREELGVCAIEGGELLDGVTQQAAPGLTFTAAPRLFAASGVRLSLQEALAERADACLGRAKAVLQLV